MLRALTTAATGMMAEQLCIDVISNNLANVNTTGFKKSRAEFQDLLSQTIQAPGALTSQGTNQPVGIQVGLGTKTSGTLTDFSEGTFSSTGGKYDLAIQGDGFFQVQLDDGTTAYTRDGSFKVDGNGQLTTSNGNIVQPQISIPADTSSVTITSDGKITVQSGNNATQTQIGTLQLAKFANPSGLLSIGNNLYTETPASGTAVQGTAGQQAFGTIQQGFLEGSNVQTVQELINLIQAERAFEGNSKLINTSDEMLKTVNRIG